MLNDSKLLFELERFALDQGILMLKTQEIMRKGVFEDQVISNINVLIDGIVKIAKLIRTAQCAYIFDEVNEIFNEVGSGYEELVLTYKTNNSDKIISLFSDYLIPRYFEFRNGLSNYIDNFTGLQSAVISGVNFISMNINKLIDASKVRIVAFISDESEHNGKFIDNIAVVDSKEVENIVVDLLIITDNYSSSKAKTIIDLRKFVENSYDFETYRAYKSFISYKNDNTINGFVTGLSYAEVGVDINELKPYNVVNLAVSSQDLFYDYQWVKMLVQRQNINFVFIGLSYYSFEYDLSKSNMKDKMKIYSSFLEEENERILPDIKLFKQVANKVFKYNFIEILFDILKVVGESWWDSYVSRKMEKNDIEMGRDLAFKDCSKNYPNTVLKNIEILIKMISLLQSNNIRPILLVCPTSKYYYNFFSQRIKNEFKENIKKITEDFQIDIIDLFESESFSDNDFYDASHLNKEGAQKFTLILKEYLDNIFK
ncbi:hypothetical protein [Paenibacillus polymyxa]|uniref:hypothetical protein n=1 Tax=Paenibacillus polymyxa TaxID=1406 RepID=UPI0002FC6BC7|nr:hypothetical protein [Paenibacillus polymyxa]MBY7738395.1 hypothetical protein [Paenibacillus polymyxa]MEE4578264.1 hypothetical protein [Paenibacillus polymyxa]NMP12160.1 hypothetical protein [Paenibacillus polymyxa]UQQ34912.1 hypothetical protein LMH85_22350 [Paenibacillus polymyxa]